MTKEHFDPVTVRMPISLREAMQASADQNGRPLGAEIRFAMTTYLNRETPK